MADNTNAQDHVQHGIDGNPSGDAEKGAALGGLGGAAVGAAAGAMAGPVGMVVGAVVGGLAGAGASGLAVAAVDKVDNDNTVSGLGSGDHSGAAGSGSAGSGASGAPLPGPSLAESGLMGAQTTGAPVSGTSIGGATTTGGNVMADLTPGNDVPGVQTGGTTSAGADTRGINEKISDTITGDRIDDKTGGHVTGGMIGTGATAGAGAGTGTNAYGLYEGRHITRSEYDQLNEADRLRVQLVSETLHVDKDMRQAGEVAVSKHVVQEQVQVPVTLTHEEVVVTRRAVDQPVDATATAFQDETIRVPVHEEVAVVSKQAHVTEEIEIEKRAVSQQQTVSDTVRREELDVHGNPSGAVHVQGNSTTGTGGTGTSGTGSI